MGGKTEFPVEGLPFHRVPAGEQVPKRLQLHVGGSLDASPPSHVSHTPEGSLGQEGVPVDS